MRGMLRLFGTIVAGCFTAMVVLLTISILKKSVLDPRKPDRSPHVAVLDIRGMITSSHAFVKDAEEILDNKKVKALVVRINSPGGLVGPSQEMYDAIRRLDQKIPVVVTMGSVAASGGYYAALGARKIYANAGTLTASIGVIMEFVNTERLFDWAKVERFTMKAGKLKDVGSPSRKMLPEEKAFIQSLLNDVHEQFRLSVKERRHLTDEELNASADGRVMTGQQAKNAKLVDELGGFNDAVKEAKKLANLPDSAIVSFPSGKKGMLFEFLMGDPGEEESSFNRFFNAFNYTMERLGTQERQRILLMPAAW